MATLFIILTAIFMAATLITLGVGVFSMGKGGDFNRRNSNKLMRMRVLFQGLAIASFVLYLFAR
jgi:Hypoxia induced protein conserved region